MSGTLDLGMLAADLGEVLARDEYRVDVSETAIRHALPGFLADLTRRTAEETDHAWSDGPDAATWTADVCAADPIPQSGPAPAMTWLDWMSSQNIEIGATARDAHYWRCPICRTWAGPYADAHAGKRAGMDHRYEAHDRLAGLRLEAHREARPLVGTGFTRKVLAQLVADLAQRHELTEAAGAQAVRTVAVAIRHGGSVDDLLFHLRDGHRLTAAAAHRLAVDVATELGQSGWAVQNLTGGREGRRP
ncbi:hypothetical protein [Amycolatopsis sp. NPDC058986]|uniref:hypothetical protein n=1 Tax=unclassified Amycolatopsis TaxID=2618356 RepID=UPI00366D44EC